MFKDLELEFKDLELMFKDFEQKILLGVKTFSLRERDFFPYGERHFVGGLDAVVFGEDNFGLEGACLLEVHQGV